MLNEIFLIQTMLMVTLWFFLKAINILILWYLGGIYLVLLGMYLFLKDGDIFVGFLWIIDLGVGLIFFIFILHFSFFLYQKTIINLFERYLLFGLFFTPFYLFIYTYLYNPIDSLGNIFFKRSWFFFISWYNFFNFFNSFLTTNLNLLREIYFFNNSLEFFIINFMLLYGIFTSILLSFFLKTFFTSFLLPQFKNFPLLKTVESVFFIRNQNFIKQQHTSTGTRVWSKKKNKI